MNTAKEMGRHEIKYYIEPALVHPILDYARKYVEYDNYAKSQPDHLYTVRSLYYDSPDLDFYWEKLDGIKVRRKLRIRTYNTRDKNSTAFLEIKRRYNSTIVKERAQYPFDAVVKMMKNPEQVKIDDSTTSEGSLVLGKWIDNIIRWQLEPTMMVVYERQPFVGLYDDDNRSRLTIDYNLRVGVISAVNDMFDDSDLIPITSNLCILEMKYNHFMPKWMRGLVKEMRLSQQSISKYCIGVQESVFSNS